MLAPFHICNRMVYVAIPPTFVCLRGTQQLESYIGCIVKVGGTRDPKAAATLTGARSAVEMARVYAKHSEASAQTGQNGLKMGNKCVCSNPRGVGTPLEKMMFDEFFDPHETHSGSSRVG